MLSSTLKISGGAEKNGGQNTSVEQKSPFFQHHDGLLQESFSLPPPSSQLL
jgi:hypothetical protein